MSSKNTKITATSNLIHQIPAGILIGDKRTELFGCRETQNVFAISNGQTIPFEEIPPVKKAKLFETLLNDPIAMEDLQKMTHEEAIKTFAFCLYGAADSNADFCEDGELKPSENFICSNNCRCLKWDSKSITINGNRLTSKKVEILQLLATDLPDKQIAEQLNITHSTLDSHKSKLFELAGVQSKAGLIVKSIDEKIIQ